MSPAGNTPWWQRVSDAADKMAYDCDAQLGVPAPHDCAKVEDGQLGADDDTISVGAGVVKLLSSGQCSRNYKESRARMMTHVRQAHVKSLLRQQQLPHSTGVRYVQHWILSLTSASNPRGPKAAEAKPTSGLPMSAVGPAGKSDRMTTNSPVSGQCPALVRKARTDGDRAERSTTWSYSHHIKIAATATRTGARRQLYVDRELHYACEYHVCCAGPLTRQLGNEGSMFNRTFECHNGTRRRFWVRQSSIVVNWSAFGFSQSLLFSLCIFDTARCFLPLVIIESRYTRERRNWGMVNLCAIISSA